MIHVKANIAILDFKFGDAFCPKIKENLQHISIGCKTLIFKINQV